MLLAGSARAGEVRIVGGEPSEPGAWPDVVALFAGDTFLCTGTLIAPRWVLTAGHCDWGLTRAVLGSTDLDTPTETIGITAVTAHPDYWDTFDLALVKLEQAATVTPRGVALGCVLDGWLVDGARADIVGFGATDAWATDGNTLLHEARVRVEDADCTTIAAGCRPAISPGGELIAGGGGVDSCSGDSGGPIYLDTLDGAFLVGVTSRSTDGATVTCGEGGIYTRPDGARAWIEDVLGEALTEPACTPLANHRPSPRAAPLRVAQGETALMHLDPGDPDTNQSWTWTLLTPPSAGMLTLTPDGHAAYTAGWDAHGEDHFVVEVVDDGEPALSAVLRVDVEVLQVLVQRGRTGCDTGGGSGGAVVVGLIALAWRRAQRKNGSSSTSHSSPASSSSSR